jgi:hypothetical protein
MTRSYIEGVWELHLERDGDERTSTLYRIDDERQLQLVASERWGPFDTQADVAQWVWKWLTRTLHRTMG